MTKAGFYVDGFNLYHAIDGLNRPYLKWLDLRSLGERILSDRGSRAELARIVYCTAISRDVDKAARHQQYIKALEYRGVDVLKGHFSYEPAKCRAECRQRWEQPTEKRSDVHLALSLFHDACVTDITEFYLVTTDGDQAATAEFLRRHAPGKKLVTVAPPGREFNNAIRALSDGKHKLTDDLLEACRLPQVVVDNASGVIARAPAGYDPPAGWVAPQNRPRKHAG